ncbi:MAG: molybdopterin-dependent oxidoreductase [Nanoarchaeota archaeon]|nr:molybdopterin-dependent oxidoreductase [Nanoarchaeota archaeon]MBU1704945.1 molybdopterin-dependent oxidoreductase [Nanoarchaeota archaeon]
MRWIFGLVLLLMLSSGCVDNNTNTIELGAVQVKEYEGKRLDTFDAFRENSIKGPQHVDINEYSLIVDGLVGDPLQLSYEDVLAHQSYSKVVTLYCVEGWSATILWEGVLVKDLINKAGVKGKANTIIFHAYDGYTTALPLDYIIDNNIILAYKMNNVTMPRERGYPFELVAEDKEGYKWIKWVTEIELSDDPDYLGYWEKRGYSNEADI